VRPATPRETPKLQKGQRNQLLLYTDRVIEFGSVRRSALSSPLEPAVTAANLGWGRTSSTREEPHRATCFVSLTVRHEVVYLRGRQAYPPKHSLGCSKCAQVSVTLSVITDADRAAQRSGVYQDRNDRLRRANHS
jgi:hypothetical protein